MSYPIVAYNLVQTIPMDPLGLQVNLLCVITINKSKDGINVLKHIILHSKPIC
jgi:hypothetical protein